MVLLKAFLLVVLTKVRVTLRLGVSNAGNLPLRGEEKKKEIVILTKKGEGKEEIRGKSHRKAKKVMSMDIDEIN